jgi:branched-chain amino acid transport system substrate-binding protein
MLGRRLALAAAAAFVWIAPVRAEAPITIGFGMALTGGLAPIGKAALLAMQIWEADINAKGGLLGRPV